MTLDAIRPFEGEESFMAAIRREESPVPGYSARRLAHDIAELEREGMLDVFVYDGIPDSFDLTAAGRDYRRNRALDVLRAIGRHAFQLLLGASGGLVVWLLTRLAE